jgi:serine/threonine-protein kinase
MAQPDDPNATVEDVSPVPARDVAADVGPGGDKGLPAASVTTPPLQPDEPLSESLSKGALHAPRGAPGLGSPLQLHDEIARGGMGAVLRGHDTALGREVAVKVLLPAHAEKADLVQRFLEEAQIAGQLQHPGVTPVYELGRLADQRPYFTMKLVKGQTLAALLATRREPAEERPRFVGIFAQVCQTLAYAHARGVIHRDLKPSNVMVGTFGEVQVMDWGLAKVLGEGGGDGARKSPTPEEVSGIRTRRSSGPGAPEAGTQTEAGRVLGTPAYMAPEQARGDVDLVDARADVFGLGALLCYLLTGQPPFTGQRSEVVRKAQTAQLDDAWRRLDSCGADAELIGLAKRCLATEPGNRPRHAGEVAAAVTAYQDAVAQRLRQAELDHAAEVARTQEAEATAEQERKARRAAQARAWTERRARRLTLGLAAAVLALVTVGAAGGLWVQRQWAEQAAEAARQREAVETALDKAGLLRRQGRWAEARAILEQTHNRLGEGGAEDLRQRVEQATADLALVDRLDAIRLKRSTWIEGRFDDRTAALDYAAAFRDAGLGEEREAAETVAARARASAVSEPLVAALDDWAFVDPQRREWLLEVARRADPDPWRDRFRDPRVWSNRVSLEALAKELLADPKQLARQKPPLLTALGAALLATNADPLPLLAEAQARHPDDFWLNFNLGNAFYSAGKWEEAISFFRGAVALRPSAVAVHNNLGNALYNRKQLDQAIQTFRRAIELDPRFAYPHLGLGNVLRDKHQLDEAIEAYRKAIQLDPRDAGPHHGLGLALYDKKQLDEAIQELRKAIDLDPMSAPAYSDLGLFLQANQQPDEAIKAHRKAIALDPKYARAHHNFAAALRDKQQLDEAIQQLRIAIGLDPRYALGHYSLGSALYAKRQVDEAIQEFRTAIQLDPKFAMAHNALGTALREKEHPDEAMQEFRTAIRLDPKYASAHYNLGNVLYARRELDEAGKEYRLAIALKGDHAQAHCNLGHLLRDRGQFAAALEELRKGHELGSRQPGWPYPSAQWVRKAERLAALDQKLAAILEGKEKPARAEHLDLAHLCQLPYKQLYAASCRFYAEAFIDDPKLADDMQRRPRYNAACAAALSGCGQGKDADKLSDKERARLRKQAVEWLRADLAHWSKQAGSDKAAERGLAQKALQHWQVDPDLASLRARDAVAQLPADERKACEQLWAEVDALLRKVKAPQ